MAATMKTKEEEKYRVNIMKKMDCSKTIVKVRDSIET